MGRVLFFLNIFSAFAWSIDMPQGFGACNYDGLVRSSGRDEPVALQFENWAIGDGRFLFQQRKQVVAPGILGEIGELFRPQGNGFYLQVDSHPGGQAYRTDPGAEKGSFPRKQDIALGTILKALREDKAAQDAEYFLLMGENAGLDGQVKKIQGVVGLDVKLRAHIEKPSNWDGFYKEGQTEVTLAQGTDGQYKTVNLVLRRIPSLAARIARATGKPVIAPAGEPRTWFHPETGELEIAVFRRTATYAKIVPKEQAFVKVHPDGKVEAVENPLVHIRGGKGVRVKYVLKNPEFNNPAVLDLRDPSALPSERETLERLHDFGLIPFEEYMRRRRELDDREGE